MTAQEVEAFLQPGFQRNFVNSHAEIAIGGGAAGVGKSRALLHTGFTLGHVTPNVPAIIFRRQYKQLSITGGLWDQAQEFALQFPLDDRPVARSNDHTFLFPNKSKLQFDHLADANKTHYAYQGAQFGFIGYDELTHFTKQQFFYMMARNRTPAMRRPFIRATTNPQGDGWVKDLISWWLYPPDYPDETLADYPRWDRAGVIRFFTNFEDATFWGDTRDQVLDSLPDSVRKEYDRQQIKSITFIPGRLEDNVILAKANPNYRASLLAMSYNERMQLLYGRWRTSDVGDDILFLSNVVADLWTNTFVTGDGNMYITTDIAMEGRDHFVIMVWDGYVIKHIIRIPKSDGKTVLDTLQNVARQWHVPNRNICFDASGLGGYLRGFLQTARPFFGGGKPIEQDHAVTHEQDDTKPMYDNLRTQCYYVLSEKMENCELFNEVDDPDLKRLLTQELRETRKGETGPDQKRTLVKKPVIAQKIGRSPDLADVLSMRMVFDLKPTTTQKRRGFRKVR